MSAEPTHAVCIAELARLKAAADERRGRVEELSSQLADALAENARYRSALERILGGELPNRITLFRNIARAALAIKETP